MPRKKLRSKRSPHARSETESVTRGERKVQIRKLVAEGTKGPDGKERMPAFKTLTSDQVTSLIMHVRSFQ